MSGVSLTISWNVPRILGRLAKISRVLGCFLFLVIGFVLRESSRPVDAGAMLLHRSEPSLGAGVPAIHGLQACCNIAPASTDLLRVYDSRGRS
jgi:hypothetical protein